MVVGTGIVERLTTGSDPLGKEVRLDGWTYRVIEVGKKQAKTMGKSQDNDVMITNTAYLRQYGVHNQNIRIPGKAASAGPPLNVAIDEARAALRASRHDRPEADDSFDIETNASLLGVWADFSSTFFIATIGIACISLVVGGIGLMYLMLVAVTERTREIGIRKALGARPADVLLQFLIEAGTLSGMGGAFGGFFGVAPAERITFLI